jgi:hypothetical protein
VTVSQHAQFLNLCCAAALDSSLQLALHLLQQACEDCVEVRELESRLERRAYIVEFALAWLAALVVASVPVWFAMRAAAY